MNETRKELKKLGEERKRFSGKFIRFGKKTAFRGPDKITLLLNDVTDLDTGGVVTDHLWFNETEGFKAVYPLEAGDILEFDARVKAYEKGYKGRGWEATIDHPTSHDYKLSHPTKIIISRITGA